MTVGRHQTENVYLNEDFTAYMQSKNFAPATQKMYLDSISQFLQWIEKEPTNCTKKDVLKYLEYLKQQRRLENISRRMRLTGLNHYFTFLYKAEQITSNPTALLKIRGTNKIHLYRIFTAEELTQLFDNYYLLFVKNFDASLIPASSIKQAELSRERNAAIISIFFNQGATTTEIDKMLLQDINLQKATIKIRGGKRSNERNVPLKAEQIGLLINYIQNIRPQFLTNTTAASEKLFLPYPTKNNREATNQESIMDLFKSITHHLKSIDKNLLNFKQVRASVITGWLKLYGLRKTQYYAGHRYIRGTEYYLPNNLDELTNDISKHHPF
jgi:site-specific recombinase XerD